MNLSRTFDTRLAAAVTGLLCALIYASPTEGQSSVVSANSPVESAEPASPTSDAAVSTARTPPAPVPDLEDNPETHLIGGRSSNDNVINRTDDNRSGRSFEWLSGFWPLFVVVAVIILMFWLARKYLPGVRRLGGSRTIKLLARTHLSPRQSIALVRVGRRLLVVGQSADRLSALDSISDPQEVSELLGQCESDGASGAVENFKKTFKQIDEDFSAAEEQGADCETQELSRIRGEVESLSKKVRGLADLRGK